MAQVVTKAFMNCRKFIRTGFFCVLNMTFAIYSIWHGAEPLMLNVRQLTSPEIGQASTKVTSGNSTEPALNSTTGNSTTSRAKSTMPTEPNLNQILSKIYDARPNPDFIIHAFFFLMPLALLLHNHELKRVYQLQESTSMLLFKSLLIIIYYTMLITTCF